MKLPNAHVILIPALLFAVMGLTACDQAEKVASDEVKKVTDNATDEAKKSISGILGGDEKSSSGEAEDKKSSEEKDEE